MPHSSGGGSHRGGLHGGGFHGSGFRGGFSMNTSASRGNDRKHIISSRRFAGARRYVYYRRQKPHYFYSNYNPAEKTKKTAMDLFFGIFLGLFSLPLLVFAIVTIYGALNRQEPGKMNMNYDTRIEITDRAGILGDTEGLRTALEDFQDVTGITPAVVTVNNDTWMNYNGFLEGYAYDLYVGRFKDESHWLLVYSEPQNPEGDFVDWYWEGMQGNDTDRILTEEKCSQFNVSLHNYLSERNNYTVNEAFTRAFGEFTPIVMKGSVRWGNLIVAILLLPFSVVMICVAFEFNPWKLKYRKAVPCDEDSGFLLNGEETGHQKM